MTIQKANTIALPANFDPRNPAAVLALLGNDGVDVFTVYREDVHLITPVLTVEPLDVASGAYLAVTEFPYALTLDAEVAAVASGGFADEIYIESAAVASQPFVDLIELQYLGTDSYAIATGPVADLIEIEGSIITSGPFVDATETNIDAAPDDYWNSYVTQAWNPLREAFVDWWAD